MLYVKLGYKIQDNPKTARLKVFRLILMLLGIKAIPRIPEPEADPVPNRAECPDCLPTESLRFNTHGIQEPII